MNSRLLIKTLLLQEKLTLKWLADKLTEVTGKKYSQQSLSKHINMGKLSYNEVILITEILDYEMEIIKRN